MGRSRKGRASNDGRALPAFSGPRTTTDKRLMGVSSLCVAILGATLAAGCGPQAVHGGLPQVGIGAAKKGVRTSELERRMTRVRNGEPLRGDIRVFMRDRDLSPEAKMLFDSGLREGPESSREALVNALVELGRHAAASKGSQMIRDPAVIGLLTGPCLSRVDSTRDVALSALLTSVSVELLRPNSEQLVADLKAHAGTDAFLLIAKVKPPGAKDVVEAYASQPEWASDEAVRIARAALGDDHIEQELIRGFLETQAPEVKAERAKVLAHVGTPAALRALATEMRTPLIVEMRMVMRRSVRVDIMEALSFTFPDNPLFWGVSNDGGYAAVEAFCEQRFGVRYQTPRPPFLTVEGFPSSYSP